jgi:serine/threonine-protein kinase RsbW
MGDKETSRAASDERLASPVRTEPTLGRSASEEIFVIASDVEAIAPTVDSVVAVIRRAGCIPGKESDVEIALFEALANAVVHGNGQDRSKKVEIRCRCVRNKDVSITVKDQGNGFDPSKVPDPTAAENLEAEHGRGILMMKTFMDEVHFKKRGTEVQMRKNSNHAPSPRGLRRFWEALQDSGKRIFGLRGI